MPYTQSPQTTPKHDRILTIFMITLFIILAGAIIFLLRHNARTAEESSPFEYYSSPDLSLSSGNWQYDKKHDVYYQLGLVYVNRPVDVRVESLAIFVPGSLLRCNANSSSTYSCVSTGSAPAVISAEALDFSAVTSPTNYDYDSVKAYLEAGLIYVLPGFRGQDPSSNTSGDLYPGGAPWAVADLKAAVRYIHHNAPSLPLNESAIFARGSLASGALVSLLGISGNSSSYETYLSALGAATTSDSLAGVAAWNPLFPVYSSASATNLPSSLDTSSLSTEEFPYANSLISPLYDPAVLSGEIIPNWYLRLGLVQPLSDLQKVSSFANFLETSPAVTNLSYVTVPGQGRTDSELSGSATQNFLSWLLSL